MSLTDPGRELNDDYHTLGRLQDEVRHSDEIYRLLYKKGSLFQGEGLQDLKKEYRGLLGSLVRQVLDLIEDHHAKIRAKAPRFSFNVDPSIYDDVFYHKAPVQDEEQAAALELLARASKAEEDSDGEGEDDEDRRVILSPHRRGSNMQRVPIRRQSVLPSQRSPKGAAAQGKQPLGGPMPKLFPEQKSYQLTRSPSKGWHVVGAAAGIPPAALAPPLSLRKRTQFYENPNVLGAMVTGRTIGEVSLEASIPEDEAGGSSSSENHMRRRVQGIEPIFISHFGPETRPPASHIKHDSKSTTPVPDSVPEPLPGAPPQPYSRPNVLAYVKGTIPRAKSVRPLKPSEAAALAEAANKPQQPQPQQQRQSVSPARSRPSTADGLKSAAAAAASRSKSVVLAQEEAVDVPVILSSPPMMMKRPTLTFAGEASSSSSVPSTSAAPPPRPRPAVKFKDEGANAISLTGPGVGGRASFINIDPEMLERRPSYGRIRDFPVVVPSILNSEVGLTFPENADIFSALPEVDEDEENV